MKPVQSLPNTNSARPIASSTSSADPVRGADFASLFSSVSANNPQPAATPVRAPHKPAQANATPPAGKAAQAQPDAPAVPNAQAEPEATNSAAPAQTQTQAQASQENQGEEELESSPAQAEATAVLDPAAQLLAMTQQAQQLVQSKDGARAEAKDGLADAGGERRGHGTRGAPGVQALGAAQSEDLRETEAGDEAAHTDFLNHLSDVQALQGGKAAKADDALITLTSRQDSPAAPVAPQTLVNAAAALRAPESPQAARSAGEHLAPRVGASGWDRALGQKVVWMVGQGEQSASLTLNPPDLGPLQVVLTVSNTQASADFSSAQPEVRQALQDALPRLREMLADAGIALGQANVHAGGGDQAHQASQGQAGRGGHGGAQGDSKAQAATAETRASAPVRQGVGLVNTFA
jgi:flagellar hook-length control protein FliK